MRLVLLAVFALTLSADRADACKCVARSVDANMKQATAVFLGTVEKFEISNERVRIELAVEGVWKGSPGKLVVLDPGHGTGDCTFGPRLMVNDRWVIFARGNGRIFKLGMCEGHQKATAQVLDKMTKQFGAPKKP